MNEALLRLVAVGFSQELVEPAGKRLDHNNELHETISFVSKAIAL